MLRQGAMGLSGRDRQLQGHVCLADQPLYSIPLRYGRQVNAKAYRIDELDRNDIPICIEIDVPPMAKIARSHNRSVSNLNKEYVDPF